MLGYGFVTGRQGLMDDAGYHDFDYEPDCSTCKYAGVVEKNGELYHHCDIKYCNYKEGREE